MILTCPNCGTQYVVKDGAVPPGGRQVRCTACKHSWHQDPESPARADESAQPALEPEDQTVTGEERDESIAEATLVEPRSGPEAEEWAYEETMIEDSEESAESPPEQQPEPESGPDPYAASQFDIVKRDPPGAAPADWREPPQAEAEDDQFSPFAAPDEVAPKRRSPIFGLAIAAIVIIAIAAALWFLVPGEWRARLGLGETGASPLALVTTHMDRQKLESGNELLTVTGRVINPTSNEQEVPPIQAQLKTRTGKIVYSWTIAPPARSLAPGASASFNSAEVNIPPGGDELTITLGTPAG
ncbi:MAG TPA: zinc-ribbon domain-containing protein [Sphingomicrobium sp.]|nr:zinc-ribbon domain-containing protein [Sphingomicrobium sp.]